jgi:hypothetical protein
MNNGKWSGRLSACEERLRELEMNRYGTPQAAKQTRNCDPVFGRKSGPQKSGSENVSDIDLAPGENFRRSMVFEKILRKREIGGPTVQALSNQ